MNNNDINTPISSDPPKQKETSAEGSTMKSYNENLEGETSVNKHAKTSLLRTLRRRFHEHHAKTKEDKAVDSGFKDSKLSKKPRRFGSKAHNNRKLSRSNTYNGPFQRSSRKDESSKGKFHKLSFRSKLPSYFGGSIKERRTHELYNETGAQVFESLHLIDDKAKPQSSQVSEKFQCSKNRPKNVSDEFKHTEDEANDRAHKELKKEKPPSVLSLFYIIQHSGQLIAVNVQRGPDKKWGIELNQEGDPPISQNDTENKGKNTVDSAKKPVLRPDAIQPEASASMSESHHGHSAADFRTIVLQRSFKKSKSGRQKAPNCSEAKEVLTQPRHGVCIAGLTEEGVAASGGKLAVEDLIVEVTFDLILQSVYALVVYSSAHPTPTPMGQPPGQFLISTELSG